MKFLIICDGGGDFWWSKMNPKQRSTRSLILCYYYFLILVLLINLDKKCDANPAGRYSSSLIRPNRGPYHHHHHGSHQRSFKNFDDKLSVLFKTVSSNTGHRSQSPNINKNNNDAIFINADQNGSHRTISNHIVFNAKTNNSNNLLEQKAPRNTNELVLLIPSTGTKTTTVADDNNDGANNNHDDGGFEIRHHHQQQQQSATSKSNSYYLTIVDGDDGAGGGGGGGGPVPQKITTKKISSETKKKNPSNDVSGQQHHHHHPTTSAAQSTPTNKNEFDDNNGKNENMDTVVVLINGTTSMASASSSQSKISTSIFHCPEQFGYFSDRHDCSRYYVCVFGDPLHETCTGGLYFSSELQTCDWPQNVDCTMTINSGTVSISPTTTSTTGTAHHGVNNNDDSDEDAGRHQQKSYINGKNDIIHHHHHHHHHNVEKKIQLNKTQENNDEDDDDDDDDIRSNRPNGSSTTGQTTTEASSEFGVPVNNNATDDDGYDYTNNDLGNPDFDESIASFVDTNGEVYVQDSPHGLYSLMEQNTGPFVEEQSSSATRAINSIHHHHQQNKKTKKNHAKAIKLDEDYDDNDNNGNLKYGNDPITTTTKITNETERVVVECTTGDGCMIKNVRFDDEINDNKESYNRHLDDPDDPGQQEQTVPKNGNGDDGRTTKNPYPEHLLPRLKIVKKQLKDFEHETLGGDSTNQVVENNGNKEERVDDDEISNVNDNSDDELTELEDEDEKIVVDSKPTVLVAVIQQDSSPSTPPPSLAPSSSGSMAKEQKRPSSSLASVEEDEEEGLKDHPKSTTITFVADTENDDYLNKRDLWNYEISNGNGKKPLAIGKSSRITKTTTAMSFTDSFGNENRYSRFRNFQRSTPFNDYDRYSFQPRLKPPPPQPPVPVLTEDTIMQIFQGPRSRYSSNQYGGKNSTNRRRYLLQSLAIPLYSFPATTDYRHRHRPIINPISPIRIVPAPQQPPPTPPPPIESIGRTNPANQIIFYSYRDQLISKNPENKSPMRLANYSYTSYSSMDSTLPTPRPKSDLTTEVFTIRSEDFLQKTNNSSSSSMQASQIHEKRLKPLLTSSKSHWSTVKNVTMAPPINLRPTTTIETSSIIPSPLPVVAPANYSKVIESTNFILPPPSPPQSNSDHHHNIHHYHHQQCDPKLNCRLPKCFCPGVKPPYGFKRKEIPQMILLTFDDAVNDVNFPLYQEIFEHQPRSTGRRTTVNNNNGRTNPNGCPIKSTFFVSHEWTDYGKVQTLYARGHEIASHSITHGYGEKFTAKDWYREIAGQREILHRYAAIPKQEIRGMRAPFLQIGGDEQFQMLMDANMTYDSSISIFDNAPPYWPYTMDFGIQHDCMITPCPTRSYPGLWEIGLIMWHDLVGGGRCTMANSCTSPSDEQGVFDLIMTNFKRHYETNRAPFGLSYQSNWFTSAHHKAGFLRFVDEVLKLGDVYFVTNWQLLQWIQHPTPLERLDQFEPWLCGENNQIITAECLVPNICHVKFQKGKNIGSRFFKTCQRCPTDYPWIDNVDQLLNG